MKNHRIAIAAFFLILPILGRTLWYYHGIYQPGAPVSTPDFSGEKMPQPDLSTSIPEIITAKNSAAPVVLVDMTHSNSFLLSEIEPLTRSLVNRGAIVQVTSNSNPLWDDLKFARAYVVICPTLDFLDSEIMAVEKFVDRGGRLMVITDPTRDIYLEPGVSETPFDGVDVANMLLHHFGISFIKDYAYNLLENEANFRNVISKDMFSDPVMNGINRVVFYSAHTLNTNAQGLAFGDKNTFSSLTDSGGKLPLAAMSSNGNVVAVGDMTFMTVPYISVADNQIFSSNLSEFLVGGKKSHDLEDSPYLFQRPVSILKSADLPLNSDLIESISSIQRHLDGLDIPAQLAQESKQGVDTLVLGTYSSKEKEFLGKYISGFKLVYSDEDLDAKTDTGTKLPGNIIEESKSGTPTPVQALDSSVAPAVTETPGEGELPKTVILPGFGKLKAGETGIILFASSAEQNTVIMLAGSGKGLKELTSVLIDGLHGCLVRGDAAVCTLSGDGYSSDSGYTPSELQLPADNEAPAGTATPSG